MKTPKQILEKMEKEIKEGKELDGKIQFYLGKISASKQRWKEELEFLERFRNKLLNWQIHGTPLAEIKSRIAELREVLK